MPRKGKERGMLWAVFWILAFVVAVMGFPQLFGPPEYVEANVIRVIDNAIVLGSNCTAIIAETSPERANSIRLGLENRIDARPNTHDIFVESMKSFNITVDSVALEDYNGEFYFGSLVLTGGRKMQKIDIKPSDAIAIALRADAPIYINSTLLEEQGVDIC